MRRNPKGERTPTEIEHDIERTRERMSSNLDELGERLRPDNLKRQATDALAHKAQGVVGTVGDRARQTGSRVGDLVKANPVRVAAGTLGAVWLLWPRKRRRLVNTRNTLGLAAGAAITRVALGMLLPETEGERRAHG